MQRLRRIRGIGLAALIVLAAVACGERDGDDAFADYWARGDARGAAPDHGDWQRVLERFVIAEDDALNRVDYAGLRDDGLATLNRYLDAMTALDPRTLARDEQMAYWINVYNALTVRLIATNWPVRSILELGDGALARGPWDDPIVRVNGRALTLNDIEHRILRALWREPRIHFAVNCASVGCPDLQLRPFTGETLEAMLQSSAQRFLASPRGVSIDDTGMTLSSLFDWYAEDFGDGEAAVIDALADLADDATAAKLRSHGGRIRYDYDWTVNGLAPVAAADEAPDAQ